MDAWTALIGTTFLCWMAASDVFRRRLPNAVVLAFALCYPLHNWLGNHGSTVLSAHAVAAGAGFLLFSIFYALRWMAGGDAKLAAAVFLWAGPYYAADILMLTALFGISIALCQLFAKPHLSPDSVWHASRGTPYGVALAAGGMWAIWRPFFGGSALF